MFSLLRKRRSTPKKRFTFRPQLEGLETRLVPTYFLWDPTVGNSWTNQNNWDINGAKGVHNGIPQNVDDIASFGRYTSACDDASGTIAGIEITNLYTGNITLGGTLTVGNDTNSSMLGGTGVIDLKGKELVMKGPNDNWTNGSFITSVAGGDLNIRGSLNADLSTIKTCATEVIVYGTLTFSGPGGLDFSNIGYLDISGAVLIAPTTPASISFKGGPFMGSYCSGNGTFTFNDPTFFVYWPMDVDLQDSSVLKVEPGTYVSSPGRIVAENNSLVWLQASGAQTATSLGFDSVNMRDNSILDVNGFSDNYTNAIINNILYMGGTSRLMLGINDQFLYHQPELTIGFWELDGSTSYEPYVVDSATGTFQSAMVATQTIKFDTNTTRVDAVFTDPSNMPTGIGTAIIQAQNIAGAFSTFGSYTDNVGDGHNRLSYMADTWSLSN